MGSKKYNILIKDLTLSKDSWNNIFQNKMSIDQNKHHNKLRINLRDQGNQETS